MPCFLVEQSAFLPIQHEELLPMIKTLFRKEDAEISLGDLKKPTFSKQNRISDICSLLRSKFGFSILYHKYDSNFIEGISIGRSFGSSYSVYVGQICREVIKSFLIKLSSLCPGISMYFVFLVVEKSRGGKESLIPLRWRIKDQNLEEATGELKISYGEPRLPRRFAELSPAIVLSKQNTLVPIGELFAGKLAQRLTCTYPLPVPSGVLEYSSHIHILSYLGFKVDYKREGGQTFLSNLRPTLGTLAEAFPYGRFLAWSGETLRILSENTDEDISLEILIPPCVEAIRFTARRGKLTEEQGDVQFVF